MNTISNIKIYTINFKVRGVAFPNPRIIKKKKQLI